MIRSIIVDDEPASRSSLQLVLNQYIPEVALVGEAASATQAFDLIQTLNPELVFLDVEMTSCSGFDLLARFPEPSFGVVFCTAHDRYALSAIRCDAIDYLLKPIQIHEVKSAVQKFAKTRPKHSQNSQLHQKVDSESASSVYHKRTDHRKIAVPDLKGISFVEIDRITYLKADNNYSALHLVDGKTLCSSRTLKEYEALLVEEGFFRISKSSLVNLKYVKRYIKGSGGFVLLKSGTQLEVSRRKKETLLEELLAR